MEGVLNMAINPHDDYESLAKLLYPSIEASGNVYYGQTRKLTIDEVFDKNGKGFHAHIESLKKDDSEKYDTYYCWELGPLSGVVRVPEVLPMVPMCFAKYELEINTDEIEHELHSGNFNSYERNVSAVYKGIKKTRGKSPVDDEADWDDANFYVKKEDDQKWYLYVALKDVANDEYVEREPYTYTAPPYEEGDELTFTVVSETSQENPLTISLISSGSITNKNIYDYSIDNGSTWNTLVADDSSSTITNLHNSSVIKFKYNSSTKSLQDSGSYLRIKITGVGDIEVSGDIRSLLDDPNKVKAYELYSFFAGITQIVSAENLKLPSGEVGRAGYSNLFNGCQRLVIPPKVLPAITLYDFCYYFMFSGCTSLKYAPELPATDLRNIESDPNPGFSYITQYYSNMFRNCTSLKYAPELPATTLSGYCYEYMFYGCASLEAAPILPAKEVPFAYVYNNMFCGCTSLVKGPVILAKNASLAGSYNYMFNGCTSLRIPPKIHTVMSSSSAYRALYEGMFEGCSSIKVSPAILTNVYALNSSTPKLFKNAFKNCTNLSKVYFYCTADNDYQYNESDFSNWLEGVASTGDFYHDGSIEFPTNSASGIPAGWNVHDIYAEYYDGSADFKKYGKDKQEVLITSGTDSDFNGRGKLSDKSTVNNMESSFNVAAHPMGTYNQDGSYNQEIWGYKCFNSPVAFRNGIYGEFGSLTSFDPSDINNAYGEPKGGIELACRDDNENRESVLRQHYDTYTENVEESKETCFELDARYSDKHSGIAAWTGELENNGCVYIAACASSLINPTNGPRIMLKSLTVNSNTYTIAQIDAGHIYLNGTVHANNIEGVIDNAKKLAYTSSDDDIRLEATSTGVTAYSSIVPGASNCNLGSPVRKWNTIYTNSLGSMDYGCQYANIRRIEVDFDIDDQIDQGISYQTHIENSRSVSIYSTRLDESFVYEEHPDDPYRKCAYVEADASDTGVVLGYSWSTDNHDKISNSVVVGESGITLSTHIDNSFISINGPLTVDGETVIDGAFFAEDTQVREFTAIDEALFRNNVFIEGNTETNGYIHVGDDLTVSGATSITGATSIASTLDVTGELSANGGIKLSGENASLYVTHSYEDYTYDKYDNFYFNIAGNNNRSEAGLHLQYDDYNKHVIAALSCGEADSNGDVTQYAQIALNSNDSSILMGPTVTVMANLAANVNAFSVVGNSHFLGKITSYSTESDAITGNLTGNVTGNLHGCIPYAIHEPNVSTITMPVGSMTLAMLQGGSIYIVYTGTNQGLNPTTAAGTAITIKEAGSYAVALRATTATTSGSNVTPTFRIGTDYLPAGNYVTLLALDSSGPIVTILMRVAD